MPYSFDSPPFACGWYSWMSMYVIPRRSVETACSMGHGWSRPRIVRAHVFVYSRAHSCSGTCRCWLQLNLMHSTTARTSRLLRSLRVTILVAVCTYCDCLCGCVHPPWLSLWLCASTVTVLVDVCTYRDCPCGCMHTLWVFYSSDRLWLAYSSDVIDSDWPTAVIDSDWPTAVIDWLAYSSDRLTGLQQW